MKPSSQIKFKKRRTRRTRKKKRYKPNKKERKKERKKIKTKTKKDRSHYDKHNSTIHVSSPAGPCEKHQLGAKLFKGLRNERHPSHFNNNNNYEYK